VSETGKSFTADQARVIVEEIGIDWATAPFVYSFQESTSSHRDPPPGKRHASTANRQPSVE
jgi:hypothetical protein